MSNRVKHSSGRWYYSPSDKLNPDRAFGIVKELGAEHCAEMGVEYATEVIAEVCVAEDPDREEADARLIAAAPLLLKACEEITHNDFLGNFSAILCEDNEASDAVAKAVVNCRMASLLATTLSDLRRTVPD